ncbi:hypothetical protein LINGRAHAP2_LOCUS16011 [Linum grandiflorum]
MAAIHFVPAAAYVLLLSLSLVGSIAGGQYYPRSAGGPSEKPKIMRPEPVKPQTNGYGPKKLEEDAYPIAVEGTVICKSGSEYVPIKEIADEELQCGERCEQRDHRFAAVIVSHSPRQAHQVVPSWSFLLYSVLPVA